MNESLRTQIFMKLETPLDIALVTALSYRGADDLRSLMWTLLDQFEPRTGLPDLNLYWWDLL